MERAQEPMNINIAVNEIMAIRDQVAVMGANDSEIPHLNSLVERLGKGEVSPRQALEEAYQIQNRKAAYH